MREITKRPLGRPAVVMPRYSVTISNAENGLFFTTTGMSLLHLFAFKLG